MVGGGGGPPQAPPIPTPMFFVFDKPIGLNNTNYIQGNEQYCINYRYSLLISGYYKLQTNVLMERFNQTLSRCLVKVIDDDRRDWDKKLDTVLMSIKTSVD